MATRIVRRRRRRVRVMCPRCSYCWMYEGSSEYVISCPRCGTTMSLARARRRARGHPLTPRRRR